MDAPVVPACRAGHIAVANGKYVLIWGGYNEESASEFEKYVSSDELWIWDTQYSTWQLRYTNAEGPSNGLSGAVGLLSVIETSYSSRERVLFIIGGHGRQGSSNTMYQLNISSIFQSNPGTHVLPWRDLTEDDDTLSFSPRDKFGGWEHDGNIYIFGGFGPDISYYLCDIGDFVFDVGALMPNRGWNNQLLKYDLQTSRWSLPNVKGSVPLPRAAHGVSKLDNLLYLFGGRHQNQRLNDLHVLDMTTLTWTKIHIFDELPVGRSWHSFTRITNHQIFLFGGYSDISSIEKPLNDAWLLDVSSMRWIRMPCVEARSHARLWHTGVQSADGEVTVFGGCIDDILNTEHVVYADSIITFRILPKSLLRLTLDAAFRFRTALRPHYTDLPIALYNELCERETITSSMTQH